MHKQFSIAWILILPILFSSSILGQTSFTPNCDPTGNWILFANYDGGNLNIVVDQNIPNLKIGICTYEPVNVTFSGPFVNSVTEVLYAGFNSAQNNNNCSFPITTSSFTGINPAILTVNVAPPVTIISPPNPNYFNIPIFQYSNIPIFHYSSFPIFQFSNIPVFQYSNIPLFQHSSIPALLRSLICVHPR